MHRAREKSIGGYMEHLMAMCHRKRWKAEGIMSHATVQLVAQLCELFECGGGICQSLLAELDGGELFNAISISLHILP